MKIKDLIPDRSENFLRDFAEGVACMAAVVAVLAFVYLGLFL
jgi:hypothetical protein